jgi:hypothetical protein
MTALPNPSSIRKDTFKKVCLLQLSKSIFHGSSVKVEVVTAVSPVVGIVVLLS